MSATKVQTSRESAREARELAKAFRDMERAESLSPSEKAKAIVRAREENDARESLREAAKDMGISAAELASDIIAERTMIENAPAITESREWEAGISMVESRERRSIVKAMIHTEHATRPDYRIARELLETIGKDSGVVVSSLPTGEIAVYAVKRAVDPEYARALHARAIAGIEKVSARIESAEKAIAEYPVLKNGTPAMQKELADAERAMRIARERMVKANVRLENSKAISADGIRLEETARFDYAALKDAIVLNRLTPAIESWELPNQIIRRPFKEFIRPRIRRNPISPVECEVLKREAESERAIVRAMVKAETEKVLAEKAMAEKQEAENKKSANAANRKLADKMRKRNARLAKRNAR